MGRGRHGHLYRCALDNGLLIPPRDLSPSAFTQTRCQVVADDWQGLQVQGRCRPGTYHIWTCLQDFSLSTLDSPVPRANRAVALHLHGYHLRNSVHAVRRLPHRLSARTRLVARYRWTGIPGCCSRHDHGSVVLSLGQQAIRQDLSRTRRFCTSRGTSPTMHDRWYLHSNWTLLVCVDELAKHPLDSIYRCRYTFWVWNGACILEYHELPHRCIHYLRCISVGGQFGAQKFVRRSGMFPT